LLLVALVGAGAFLFLSGRFSRSAKAASKILIDYPLEGSMFPPEITEPVFLWRDPDASVKRWAIEVSFGDHSEGIHIAQAGEPMQLGEIDTEAATGEELYKLSPQQAATLTWKPDAQTWARIKQHSMKAPATITINGMTESGAAVSTASIRISTSIDEVGAPVFYRDLPLLEAPREAKGAIQPLPPFAIPLIKWRLRYMGEAQSRTVMAHVPTCINCHSFGSDGKEIGLDLDGPKNDKGLYAVASLTKDTTIRSQDVIRWSSFLEDESARSSEPAVKRFGFMSQLSPDGRYIVTSIGPPGLKETHKDVLPGFAPGIADRLYSINFKGPPFNQVFYPTRGILAWYDRQGGTLRPLPGADDPHYVHTSAFWSPDGKYLIFSRAVARDPYPPGVAPAEYANDPHETQIQYDLYKIPFNGGRGGKAVPVAGASGNGMSNNFPKVSPDGKWIVFVQNRNGLLMRPDSRLFIVPFEGGKARLMRCNTPLMNSWHTFSPNGRWLAFSSKGRTAYTQLMLTHIDANGNDSPAILVENTTAANRAVNIPEFLNVKPDGLEKIDPQATEYYRLFIKAYDLVEDKEWAAAVPVLRQAVQYGPEEGLAHYALASALSATDQEQEAVGEYRKACELDTEKHTAWLDHLAVSQANTGDMNGAIANWRKSLAIDAKSVGAEADLGTALFENGEAKEGEEHLRKAIALEPKFADAHNHLGWELAKAGRLDEGIAELQQANAIRPNSAEYRANLGYALQLRGDVAGAVEAYQKAVELTEGKDWRLLDLLAQAYEKSARYSDAVKAGQRALDLAVQERDAEAPPRLKTNLDRYTSERDNSSPK